MATNHTRIPPDDELLEEICQLTKTLPCGCDSCSIYELCVEKGNRTREEWLYDDEEEECDGD